MKALVIGAAGDVGRGLVTAMAERGWSVAAAGRSAATLDEVAGSAAGGTVTALTGSVADAASAQALMEAAREALGGLDAVIVSVNAAKQTRPILEWSPQELLETIDANVITHFNALNAALAVLGPQGVFIGIGGGMADFIFPGSGANSVSQAALRNLYRSAAKENPGRLIRELQVSAMVNGLSTREIADDSWIKAEAIGQHACAMIERPAEFAGPVINLTVKDPVGVPPAPKR